MRTFALGIGECGRKIGLELFRMTKGNELESVNRMHAFSLIDLAEINTQMSNVHEMGIPESFVNVFQPSGAELNPEFNLFLGRMKPIFGERGVGGLWFHSKEIAEQAWDAFYGAFKYHLEGREWFSVFHSGGGGTGCGAGPVFMERIYRQVREEKTFLSENLYTATLVLPDEFWQPWREANSAAAIGRHSRISQGIIIADNMHGRVLVRNALKDNKPIETKNPKELINRRLAEVWVSLHMTNMTENQPTPKVYEAADYRRLFLNEDFASILVPCFHEYAIADFVRGGLNLRGAVFDTMKNHQLAVFKPRGFENIIVIITFPSSTTGLARQLARNIDNTEDIARMLLKMYGEDIEPAVVITYSQSLTETVKVTVLVKDPIVPRFQFLHKRLRAIVEDPLEMKKALKKMFPKEFDIAIKNQIMEGAQEEFRTALHSFSEYLRERRYDEIEMLQDIRQLFKY